MFLLKNKKKLKLAFHNYEALVSSIKVPKSADLDVIFIKKISETKPQTLMRRSLSAISDRSPIIEPLASLLNN